MLPIRQSSIRPEMAESLWRGMRLTQADASRRWVRLLVDRGATCEIGLPTRCAGEIGDTSTLLIDSKERQV